MIIPDACANPTPSVYMLNEDVYIAASGLCDVPDSG